MRLIHAHIMLVNLHLYNVIQVSLRYHFWDSFRAIIPMYPVHFMGQSVFTKLELLHILMDGHSAVLSNRRGKTPYPLGLRIIAIHDPILYYVCAIPISGKVLRAMHILIIIKVCIA